MKTFKEFLKNLEKELYFFSSDEKNQILDDYKDLYNEKINEVSEEEILKHLDTVDEIAQNYAKELDIQRYKHKKYYTNFKNQLVKCYTSKKKVRHILDGIKILAIGLIYITLIVSSVIYVLSWFLIKLETMNVVFRILESIVYGSFMLCVIIILKIICDKNE